MSDSPILNPGLGPNDIVSPDNLHTEPPFVRPVYELEEEPELEEAPEEPKVFKVRKAKK